MKNIVSEQRAFFYTHQTKSIDYRLKQLSKLEKLLKSNESLLNEAIYKDFKKSVFDTYATELALIYHDIKYAKKNIYKWSKVKRVGTNFLNFPAAMAATTGDKVS